MDVKRALKDKRAVALAAGLCVLLAGITQLAPLFWVAAAAVAATYWIVGAALTGAGLLLGLLGVGAVWFYFCDWHIAFNHAGIEFLMIAPTLLMAIGIERRKSLSWAFQEVMVVYLISTVLLYKAGLLDVGFWRLLYEEALVGPLSSSTDALVLAENLSTVWVAMFLVFSILSVGLARWFLHQLKPDALVWGSWFQIKTQSWFAALCIAIYFLPKAVEWNPVLLQGASNVAALGVIVPGLAVVHWAAQQSSWKGWVLFVNYCGLMVFKTQWMLFLTVMAMLNPWVPLHHQLEQQTVSLSRIRNLIKL